MMECLLAWSLSCVHLMNQEAGETITKSVGTL